MSKNKGPNTLHGNKAKVPGNREIIGTNLTNTITLAPQGEGNVEEAKKSVDENHK